MDCVFCGHQGPLTAEHVFPRWLRPYLEDPQGEQGTHHRILIRPELPDERNSYRGHPASLTVNSVCAACNSGWMSDLEAAAKPYLESAIVGHGRTYYEDGQALIATWLLKTALVAASKIPARAVSLYENLYEMRRPGPRTRAWLASTNRRAIHYSDVRPFHVGDRRPTPEIPPNALTAVIAVGQLAGVLVAWSDAEPSLQRMEESFGPALLELLREREVTWPPRAGRLTLDTLDQLAETVISAEDVAAQRPSP